VKLRLLRAFAGTIAANVLFFTLAVGATFLPHERIAEHVRQAFASGDLGFQDYRFFDSVRGFNQYNDCAVLQMITNDTHRPLADAVGPVHYLSNLRGDAQCRTLFDVVAGSAVRFIPTRHARYWHGYNVIAAVLLTLFPLNVVRWLLRVSVYGLVVLFAFAARRDRSVRLAAVVVAAALLAFYGLPYFSESLTHAPGDLCILIGLILLVRDPGDVLIFGAVFGSLFAYFDDLIGIIPVGTAFLFAFAYLSAVSRNAWRNAFELLGGLAIGGVTTVVAKQIAALAILGRTAASDFTQHLEIYVAPVSHTAHLPSFVAPLLTRVPVLLPFAMLANATRMLTYGSRIGAAVLLAATALAWLAAAVTAWRRVDTRDGFLAFLAAGVGIFIGWVLCAQTHTYEHAVFMVRIEIIPIALGWAALVWVSATRFGARPRS
jgi:hypothetical protein